jgi:dTDP-4-amino-4,6-dideoxygalactose transaminase
MRRPIAFGEPFVDEEDKQSLLSIFESQWLINGPKVREFEEALSGYVGSRFACGVNSCTAGMHVAMAGTGVREGDEVIMPAFSFVANGIAVLQLNAIPRFVDVDPFTFNMDADQIESKISERTKAILVLHYAGLPADMNRILEVAERHDLAVVEDAAHALGSVCAGKKIGDFGDATVFSFGPLKMIVTAGMGGMVTTRDEGLDEKIRCLISYGMNKSAYDRQDGDRPWRYVVNELGHNFRMTDAAAAMGISQLKKIDWILAQRRRLAEVYNRGLNEVRGIEVPFTSPDFVHSYLYYVIKVDQDSYGMSRDKLALLLRGKGIGVSVHWDPPLHMHNLLRRFGYKRGDFPVAEELSNTVLSLPLHCNLTEDDVGFICSTIRSRQ